MKVTFYGTRGSVPIANASSIRYGGNTTCLRIDSACLPQDLGLIVDAGSGIVPCGNDALRDGISQILLLLTHYHHDHTQGLPLSGITFAPAIKRISVYGPDEHGIGPIQMLETVMSPPYFPVAFTLVRTRFSGKPIDFPNGTVMLIHPLGGFKALQAHELERFEQSDSHQVPFGQCRHDLDECLVIRLLRSNHPQDTISYRFEERPTGKVFVFLTDHENTDALSAALRRHLAAADLLVMDSQYSREKYEQYCAGFGHGTPDYCVRTAARVGATCLGLTHHDPSATDEDIDSILAAAQRQAAECGFQGKIFPCADYQECTV